MELGADRRANRQPAPDRMVAVAAGDVGVVCDWAIALTAAAIPFRIAGPCDDARHAELWVDRDDAELARASLVAAASGRRLIW